VTREEVAGWVNDIARWIEKGAALVLGVLVVVSLYRVLSGTSLRDAIPYPQVWWPIGVGIGMTLLQLIINRVFPPEEEGPETISTEQNAENL
jgi:hypothetical protein